MLTNEQSRTVFEQSMKVNQSSSSSDHYETPSSFLLSHSSLIATVIFLDLTFFPNTIE